MGDLTARDLVVGQGAGEDGQPGGRRGAVRVARRPQVDVGARVRSPSPEPPADGQQLPHLTLLGIDTDVVLVVGVPGHGLDVGRVGDRVRTSEGRVGPEDDRNVLPRRRPVDEVERHAVDDAIEHVVGQAEPEGHRPQGTNPSAAVGRHLQVADRPVVEGLRREKSGQGGERRDEERRWAPGDRHASRQERAHGEHRGHDGTLRLAGAPAPESVDQERDRRRTYEQHQYEHGEWEADVLPSRHRYVRTDDVIRGRGRERQRTSPHARPSCRQGLPPDQSGRGHRSRRLAPPAGFEPATVGLEGRCSVQLSYEGGRGTV